MVPKLNLQIGQLVCSKAGRDKEKYYAILRFLDNSFVEVVDGEQRGLQNPKKKNLKHLRVLDLCCEKFKIAGANPQQISNTDIHQDIAELTSRM